MLPQVITSFAIDDAPLMHPYFVVIAACCYVAFVKFVKLGDHSSSAFVRRSLVLHNWVMSLGSLAMLLGLIYSLINSRQTMFQLFCDPAVTSRGSTGPLYFWMYAFYLSKVYEWLDTVFLMLRGKKVPLLHWYHHVMTFALCWVGLVTEVTFAWVGMLLNTVVHTIMYYYYASTMMAPAGTPKPWWGKYLTILQMGQFGVNFFGLLVWSYIDHSIIGGCSGGLAGLLMCGVAMVTYFALFYSMFTKKYKK